MLCGRTIEYAPHSYNKDMRASLCPCMKFILISNAQRNHIKWKRHCLLFTISKCGITITIV